MTTVTLDEARDALPDLLRRVTAGEQIVLADGDNWLGLLAPPPPKPPTAEQRAAAEAARLARCRTFIRGVLEDYERYGAPDDVLAPLRAAVADLSEGRAA